LKYEIIWTYSIENGVFISDKIDYYYREMQQRMNHVVGSEVDEKTIVVTSIFGFILMVNFRMEIVRNRFLIGFLGFMKRKVW
jgi:hypothetical protein